jgi:hypothetical protein
LKTMEYQPADQVQHLLSCEEITPGEAKGNERMGVAMNGAMLYVLDEGWKELGQRGFEGVISGGGANLWYGVPKPYPRWPPMETILLLNPPTPVVVKDAARAVRRVESLTVQDVTVETLTELLGLPGMRVTRFAIETQCGEKYLHLFCEHRHEMALCPRCLQVMEGGYDHHDRCVRHLAVWGMRTLVHFPQRRFGCGVCGEPFTENFVAGRPTAADARV